MPYLYRHIRLDKNQVFYIGISKKDDIKFSRAYNFDHRHRNRHWLNVFNKTAIEVEILFDNIPYSEAKEKEIEFIDLYKRVCDGGTLTNLTKGGDGVLGFKNPSLSERNKQGIWTGRKHTEETKLKMSLFNKGRTFSEEHKRRISEGKKGIHAGTKNPNYRGAISIFYNDEFLTTAVTVQAAADATRLNIATVSRNLNNKTVTRGYFFKRLAS